jgi:putative sigma-54 modulation protein
METDEGAKGYVKEKVQRLQKYVESLREVHVVLSAEKFRHLAEITVIGDRMTLNSQGKNSDLYAAIDQMVGKIERQIRERRLKGKRKRSDLTPSKVPLQSRGNSFKNQEGMEMPSIIQRRQTLSKPMSLEEAVAQLNLSQQDFFFFINSDSGQMNALSRCKEGGYEWVEPSSK